MASGTCETTTVYILKLSQDELDYLYELTRNYLGKSAEPDKDRLIRINIFETLREIAVE